MTPAITVAAQLAAGLTAQADRVTRYRRRVLDRGETEDVHRLRVALRRLQVAIELSRPALRLPPEVDPDIAIDTASHLGKVRDSGVARAALAELQLTAKGREAAVAERFATRFARRERRQLGRARQALRRGRVRRLLLALRRALRRPVALQPGNQPLDRGTPALVAPLWAAVVEHSAWTVPLEHPPARSVEADRSRHELRICIKRLRDAIQLLAATPARHCEEVDRLNALATSLGDLRDWSKLLAEVRGESPSLTRSVGGRVARAAQQWESLRLDFLNSPSSDLQIRPTSASVSSLRPSQST